MKKRICLNCNKELTRPWYYSDKIFAKKQFCSIKCAKIYKYRGHTITYNCEECGKEKTIRLGFYKGRKHHFCSRECVNIFWGKYSRNKNHWNWKGGISDFQKALRAQPAYEEWRNAVYKRDYWTCQDCNKKVKDIVAHHVFSFKDFPNLRYETDNGITLCRACHKVRHDDIGIKTRFKKQEVSLA